MAGFNAVYIIWLREMKKYVRNKSRFFGNLAMPFFFLAFLGMGFNSLGITGLPQGMSYLDFLAPGIVAMALLFSSMFAGISILWDRQFGFLKEIMVAPVGRTSIVVGRIFAGMTSGLVQAFFVLGISILLGAGMPSLIGLAGSAVFIVMIAVAFVGLGITLASRMEDMQGFQLIMNFLIFPTFLLSGAFFPIDKLPSWLAALAFIDPLTYGVDGLRAMITGASSLPPLLDLGILAAFCAAMIGLATWFFSKTEV